MSEVQQTGMTYPVKKTKEYLVRLTKGLLSISIQKLIILMRDLRLVIYSKSANRRMLDKSFYVEKVMVFLECGECLLRYERKKCVGVCFYDGLMFTMEVN